MDNRPAIWAGDDFDTQLRHALKALLDGNTGTDGNPILYRVDGQIAHIVAPPGEMPRLEMYSRDHLTARLTECSTWYVETRQGRRPAFPSARIVGSLAATLPMNLPACAGVRYSPLLSEDATTLVTQPGYSDITQAYHVIPTEFAAEFVGMTLQEATGHIQTLVDEFPWVDTSDYAGFVAMLLTPLTRPAYDLAPITIITKPSSRTGATLLAKVASTITTGAHAVEAQIGKGDDDEARKALSSAITSSQNRGVILLDNLDIKLAHPVLANLLTAEQWSTRRLGSNTGHIYMTPRSYALIATGNNVQIDGDILGRAQPIRLDARVEKPGDRTFDIEDLPRHTHQHRPTLLAAACRLILSWIDAGYPPAPRIRGLGGFEMWRDMHAGILAHAQIPGFLANLTRFAETQTEADSPVALLELWWDTHQRNPVSVATLMTIADPEDSETLLSISGSTPKARETSAGKALNRLKDKVYALDSGVTVAIRHCGRILTAAGKRATHYQLDTV